MGDGQQLINRLMIAIQKASVATFDRGDWLALGFQTGTHDWVQRRDRLLRGADWKHNEDYPGEAFGAITKMLSIDRDSIKTMIEFPKINAWLQQKERALWAEIAGDTTAVPPFSEHSEAIQTFLWQDAAPIGKTKEFKGKGHDSMLGILRARADEYLPGKPMVSIFQSLQDSGCDLSVEWGGTKYGVQLKSYADVSGDDFAGTTLIQIQDSRSNGLKRLYVLLAGDLTDRSQIQKLRGFESRVSRMNDPYIVLVSPERLRTLLFGTMTKQK
ncbi:MAG: hypothetical protein C0467_31720 [Planctomycetaceae bacterium]|nr:hypothetical protein [Planctomycetaceae bacterium]